MPQPPAKSNNSVCVVSLFDHNTHFLWTQSYVLPWQEVGHGKSVFEACVVTGVNDLIPSFQKRPLTVVFPCHFFQDPAASYDFNDNDPDPFPRYDSTNENK